MKNRVVVPFDFTEQKDAEPIWPLAFGPPPGTLSLGQALIEKGFDVSWAENDGYEYK